MPSIYNQIIRKYQANKDNANKKTADITGHNPQGPKADTEFSSSTHIQQDMAMGCIPNAHTDATTSLPSPNQLSQSSLSKDTASSTSQPKQNKKFMEKIGLLNQKKSWNPTFKGRQNCLLLYFIKVSRKKTML